MDNFSFVIVAMLWSLVNVKISQSLPAEKNDDKVGDYCLSEIFQPRCPKNEVIVMTSATYGRMRIGRCITAEEVAAQRSLVVGGDDPRILGCSVDVLPFLDGKCSGKNECEVRVFDISNDNARPCLHGLIVYLEASYNCIAVADEDRSCVVTVSSNPTHIVASLSSRRICGTGSKPWIVEAPLGQKIKISRLDFSSSSHGYDDQRQRQPKQTSCVSLGLIVEKVAKRNKTICRDGEEREIELFLSTGNTVEIILNDIISDGKEVMTAGENIILALQAVGCSDIIPPDDAWLKRKDDVIVIGCYSHRQTWQLICKGRRWEGAMGNCSQEITVPERVVEQEPELSTNGQVLAIVAICGFTVAICLTIMCLGAVCLRRFYAKSKGKQSYRAVDYHPFNSSNGQQTSDVAAAFTELNESRLPAQAMPTYSVYVGENGLIGTVGSNGPAKTDSTFGRL